MALPLTRRRTLALALAVAALPAAAPGQERHQLGEMALGQADAPVTVVEYAMFTCPHCKAFHETVFPRIKADFVDTGQVRVVFREVYFNRPSLWAAMVARCAPEDRYFGIVDLLFEKQEEWTRAGSDEELVAQLYAIGKQAGLTDEDMNACLSDRAFAEALVEEFQKNAEADGIDSTPSFVIGGEKLGNMSYEDFAARLNEELGN